ncbi:MAG: TonB-dependent receptor [Labilithrix sp.]
MKQAWRLLAIVLAAAAAWSPASALADEPGGKDTSDLEGLLDENVVSTASKSSEVGATAPATATIITAEELKSQGIQTLAEAIDFLSLGAATSDSQHRIDVGARGVMLPLDNGDHVLLLINGHSVNDALFTGSSFGRGAGIPIEMIDHIEVVLGPGSVLYGSNAMLGVINVITKRAKDWPGVHAGTVVEIGRSWRVTAGTGLTFAVPHIDKPAELTVGLELYKQDGPALLYDLQYAGIDRISQRPLRTSRGGLENGYWGGVARDAYYARTPAGVLRLTLGDFELSAQAKIHRSAAPYRSKFDKSYLDFDDPSSYDEQRHLWFDVTHRATLSSIVRLTSRAYVDLWDWYTDVNSSSRSACFSAGDGNIPTCTFAGRGVARWGGVEVRGSFDWLKNDRFVTLLGVDERIRQAGFKIDFLDASTRVPFASSTGIVDRQDNLLGAYLQQTWLPASWLSFNGGARLDLVTRFDPVVSPRLAAAVVPWSGGTLKGVYSTAFRAPSFIESDISQPLQIKADQLLPERVRSAEVSFEQKVGAQRLFFGVFRSWWQDLVENRQLTIAEQQELVNQGKISIQTFGVGQYRNVSSIDNLGWNARLDGSAYRVLRYGVNATGSIAERQERGLAAAPLAVAPKLFGNAHVAWELPRGWPTIGVAGTLSGRRPIDRAYDAGWTTGTIVSPQLVLRLTLTGPVPLLKGLSYRAQATYAFEDKAPYVVGPNQFKDENAPLPNLLPVDQFRTAVGLSYDLDL